MIVTDRRVRHNT